MIGTEQIKDIVVTHEIPSGIDRYELKALVDRYPYFQVGIFAYLKILYSSESYDGFAAELHRLSPVVNARKALFYFIFEEEYKQFFNETGKTEIKEDRTNILLNAFFESRGDLEVDAQLEYSLVNSSLASNDYFSYVENFEHKEIGGASSNDIDEHPMKSQDVIDLFIEKSERDGGIRIQIDKGVESGSDSELSKLADVADDMADDRFFTETLAKIYIKQKKYDKAYKIIKHLSLNYPKKNIYFADQLSFLEKLIINSKYKI